MHRTFQLLALILIAAGVFTAVHEALLAEESPPFPTRGWLPKAETGALRFLEQHPEYDGRGVVVAIFDTGVDPGVDGLQTTPDGRPKIVDMVDGSGSGDVDTSTVVEAKEGSIVGLTGRSLKIPVAWTNPTGKWRVGWKRAYELFPNDLLGRVKRHRRQAWDAQQRAQTATLMRDLQLWDRRHPKPNADQKRERKELADRLELLAAIQKKYDDPGPIFDCVVFHDGKAWQAAIDTDEDGDLTDEALMTNYRALRQFAQFDQHSLLNFCVNIYDDGDLLSIVTDCGTHATHVAGIVAAHYPQHPERNGLAPGAQIVSVKIGDRRLGSSSTGTGQIRGMTAVLRNRCDLINMSYGGSTSDPNAGRLLERYAEIIRDRNVIFVASAGNNGPALSTVGSPGGTSTALLGVGAYASPELMRNAYAQHQLRVELPYTWTSRGPAADGDLGVDICAPGGAISPVSQWSLRHRKLGNGTSMSSPNACGNLALLLSGLKSEEIEFTPTTIRRAVLNSARMLANMDPFAHGRGLIQVDKAFEYAKANNNADNDRARFEVRFPQFENARGLYLRDAYQLRTPLTTSLEVLPLLNEADGSQAKSAFDMDMRISASVDWIQAPEHMVLTYGGKSFEIRVNSSSLPPGAHFGEVLGHDANHPERGPLFRAPVTVIRPHHPETATASFQETLRLEAGDEHRRFLQAPAGATWVDVQLTADAGNEQARRFVLHALQPLPRRAYGRGFQREYITLDPGQTVIRSFPVQAGHTLELCLGQYWSSMGSSQLRVEAKFQGIQADPSEVTIRDQLAATRWEAVASLGDQWMAPEGQFTSMRRSVSPSSFELRVASNDRDELPKSRHMFESISSYKFSLDAEHEVTPRPSMTQVPEFSASWESRVWQIFDVNKQMVAGGRGAAKLAKGDYVLRLHLRHERTEMLEKWKHAPLLLDFKLSKPIDVAFFADPDEAIAGRPKVGAKRIRQGGRRVFFLGRPKAPAFAKSGDVLIGRIQIGSEKEAFHGAGRRPGGYVVRHTVVAAPDFESKKPSATMKAQEREPTPFLLEAQRRQLTVLRTQKKQEEFEALAASILAVHKHDLPTLIERLKMLDDEQRKKHLPKIVAAANAVIRRIPVKKLTWQLAHNIDPHDRAAAARRKEWETKKDWLTDALYRKGRAIAYMDLPPKPGDPAVIPKKPATFEARAKLFEENYVALRKWVDMTDPTYVLLNIRRERRQGRPAQALKLLDDLIGKQPTRALLHKKRGDIFGELGWSHWRDYESAWKIIRFPSSYPPF